MVSIRKGNLSHLSSLHLILHNHNIYKLRVIFQLYTKFYFQSKLIAVAKPNYAVTTAVRFASVDCSGTTNGTEEDDIVHFDESQSTITIPLYPVRPNEELATRKQRLV